MNVDGFDGSTSILAPELVGQSSTMPIHYGGGGGMVSMGNGANYGMHDSYPFGAPSGAKPTMVGMLTLAERRQHINRFLEKRARRYVDDVVGRHGPIVL